MSSYKNALELADAHVTEFLALLKTMGQRGICVDRKKLAKFNEQIEIKLALLQVKFSENEELKAFGGWHPKEGYKKVPKDLSGLEQITVEMPCKATCSEHCNVFGAHTHPIERWAKRKPFLATSSKQVLAYIRSKGHRIPTTKEGEETSGQKALLLAWRKYKNENYKDFVEYRKLKKLGGTYGKWRIGADDRVRTRFTLRPDTGRLSSIEPNVQNIPKDGKLAEMFRECLVASPGHYLVRADHVSVEALLTGYFAGDLDYMRLAKLGTHKYATAKYLGLPVSLSMSDEELKKLIDPIKEQDPVLYRKVKVCVYGSNYLAGPRKIFESNPEEFESQADAKNFQTFIKSLSPKIGRWQTQTITQAKMAKGLTNPFGYYKAFWDIPGGDGPSAVAFLPSSSEAFIVKECMLQLNRMESGKYMVWQIHDELVFDCPKEKVELVKAEVIEVMGQPWKELGGLSIPVSITVSESMV